jgi:hypothetical protein
MSMSFAARAKEPNSATFVKTRIPWSWSMPGDCKGTQDNEFGFVRFFRWEPSGSLKTLTAT